MILDTFMDSDLTPVGAYNFRNQHKVFGIKVDDRRRHIYIVGKTGVGKSTLLENMIIADIRSGKGVGVVDPHGELAEKILDFVPEERLDDVIYFDPSDMNYPIAFNPMEQVGNEFRHLVASGIMGVFKKIWPDAWSARMEYILNNTLLALLELPDATLLGILRMFAEPEYRRKIVENLKDPVIKAFWQNEFARYSQKLETEALAAIQNKVGQFVSNPLIRNILGQPRSALNMRQIMDTGKIFIVNLSKGKIGEDNSALLGAMIITRLNLAAMSRVDVPEQDRRDFFLYVDEFQNFATDSFANILSEARKYHLSLTLAHQYIGQLMTSDSTKVRDAIFGNVGTIITFRVGAEDGEFLEKEFMPEFLQTDLVNLAKANIYVKLMIDGVASRPFSAETIPPQPTPLNSYRDVIIKNSREKYGTPRAVVEARIAGEWLAKSDTAIDEKLGRQGERHLSEVLRPNSRPSYQSGRAPGGGVSSPGQYPRDMAGRTHAPSSPLSSSATASRSPRRVEDVQRQNFQDNQKTQGPYGGKSGSRSEDGMEKPMVRPAAVQDLRVESRPGTHSTASREMPPEESRDRITESTQPMGVQQPVRSIAEEKKPVVGPKDVSEKNVGGILRRESSVDVPASSRGLSLSALRDGGAGVRKEDGRQSIASGEILESASTKRVVRPNVDIEGLRRAINESLRKQNENGHSDTAEVALGHEEHKRQVSGEVSRVDDISRAAAPARTVRLSVPTHEDVDAKKQVDRELSKMDLEGGSTKTGNYDYGNGDSHGHDEEHDTRSIKDAREKINQSLSRQNAGFMGPAIRTIPSGRQQKSGKGPDIITSG